MTLRKWKDIFRIAPHLPSGSRAEFPDFVRGMAMIFVLLQHANVPIGDWILAFHMPLLFLLSGYIDSRYARPRPFGEYFKNRFLRLVVPYFLFEAANLVLWQLFLIQQRGWQDVTEAIKGILTVVNTDTYMGFYGRLWFLPCMFVGDILFYLVKQLSAGRKLRLWISAAILLGLSWVTSNLLSFRLPFTLDTGLFATAFLIIGYTLGDRITWLLEERHTTLDLLIFPAMLLILWFSLRFGGALCLMYENRYGNYAFTVLAALSGSAGFFLLVKWLYHWLRRSVFPKKLVIWYGVHSLATFPVHLLIKMLILFCISETCRWEILFAAMLVINIPVVNLITLYFPFFLGKFPTRKKVS